MPSRNGGCVECPLHETAQTVCIDGYGTGAAGIMLVGEAPGATEDKLGLPFVGLSGQLLTRALGRAGLKKSDVRITNAVRCRPPGNREPTPAEQKACWHYLQEEIAEFQPKVIVALGNHALKALSGRASITKARGKLIDPKKSVDLGGGVLMGSIHPAYALRRRDQGLEEQLADDFAIAARLAGRVKDSDWKRLAGLPEHVQTALLPWEYSDVDAARGLVATALGILRSCDWLACDLEWTDVNTRKDEMSWPWTIGPDGRKAELLAISFSGHCATGVGTVSLGWPEAGTELEGMVVEEVNRLLVGRRLVFHNASADGLWLVSKGLPFAPAGDTMAQAYLMDEERPRSLEALATTKCRIPPDYKHTGTTFKERPKDEETWRNLLERNGADTYATLILHDKQWDEMNALPDLVDAGLNDQGERVRPKEVVKQKDAVYRLYANQIMPLLPQVVRMGTVGTPLDRDRMKDAIVEQRGKLHLVTEKLAAETGATYEKAQLLVNSHVRLRKYLQDTYPKEIREALGTSVLPGTNKQVLSLLQPDIPFIDLVWEYRNLRNKILGTCLLPWDDMLLRQAESHPGGEYAPNIGRLHAIIKLWTKTGRTSEASEAGSSLHQAPRAKWLRSIVTAPVGYKLFVCDNSMVELRVISWLAPEQRMQDFFRQGLDLHKATAAYVSLALPEYGMTVQEFWPVREELMARVTKEQRDDAKPVNFGKAFGQGDDGFIAFSRTSYDKRFTRAQARMFHEGFVALYPGLPAYWNECERQMNRGWMATPLGRIKRHFLTVPEAINFKVQSTASELLLLALQAAQREIDERGLDAWLFNEVHDSILGCGADDDVEEAAGIVKKWMERPPTEWLGLRFEDIPVPLKADLFIGERWEK